MLWRLAAAAGGVGGLASLALPYARVSGGALGIDLEEGTYTLFGLAQLLADMGEDPQLVYLLAAAIAVGSVLALVGAFVHRWLAFAGGLVQGGSAAAFAYGVTTEGSRTFLLGLGEVDVTFEVGVFVLAAASVVALAALPLGALTNAVGGRASRS